MLSLLLWNSLFVFLLVKPKAPLNLNVSNKIKVGLRLYISLFAENQQGKLFISLKITSFSFKFSLFSFQLMENDVAVVSAFYISTDLIGYDT